ncbi:lipoprotein-releasing ABC transporter permease subunit [Polycladidibacter stylochi]|uniref:lipoprotein-releasing ABC transporter permease subunit n=1 Tax=Polycladidibacter stylochi TaxID=1807766 RepID=UPI000831AEBE|nr:lipoprotein-releasing ABC transporter permease subunit [Pseudovibrio stylochi]
MTAQSADAGPTKTRPFASFEWLLAGRYLRSKRKEAVVSVIAGLSFLGITLGVATLIIVMAVMNGFRSELLTKILGINGHILVQPIDSKFDDYKEVSARLAALDGVKFAMPFVEGQAMISGPGADLGALFRGVHKSDLDQLPLVSGNILTGSLKGFDDSNGIAIGSRLARQLGVVVGDSVRVISPRGSITPMGMTPRVKAYHIVAIFQIGMSEYDGTIVFMPFEEAQLYFNKEGLATGIELYSNDPDSVGPLRISAEEAAQRPVYVSDWRQRNMTFFSALEVERNVMFLILTLIVLVAALNIISGMTMLVKDKGRDIAVLRTMGATRGAVMRIFVITGASIGTLGTLAGFVLGTVVCLNIEAIRQGISYITRTELFSPELYFLSKLPADMDPSETGFVVLMALALSFLATLYPAWRAAKLDPVEALRYE